MKSLTFSMIIFLNLFIASSFGAPLLLNYQGTLLGDNGSPVNGIKKIIFKIYDSEKDGNLLWESAEMQAEVINGIFNVAIEGFPNDLFSEDSRYLATIVEGSELTERKRMASVPYALNATNALYASTAASVTSSEIPKAKLYVANDFQIGSGGQKIHLDKLAYGSSNNLSNGEYVVPVTGYYHISAIISFSSNQRIFIVLKVNGGVVLFGSDAIDSMRSCAASDFYLKEGDKVQFEVYTDKGGTVLGGPYSCSMSIHLFSK